MNDVDLAAGVVLKAQIDRIAAMQAGVADSAVKVHPDFVDADGKQLYGFQHIKAALGDTAYNTLVAALKTSITTALTSRATAAATEFAALGS